MTRVLLIEDNPGDARLIRIMLADESTARPVASDFDLQWVQQLASGLECLAAGGIDVVLLDLSLPDSQGWDTFARVHAQAPQIPIVMLTSLDDEDMAVRAMREGAQGYLVKGQVNGLLLTRAMRYAIERKRIEEALALQVKQLTALSQAAQAVNASLDPDRVLTEIVSLAGQATSSDYTSVVLMDQAGRIGSSAENLPGVPSIEHRVRKNGLTSWITRTNHAVVVDEIDADGKIKPQIEAGAPDRVNPAILKAGIKALAGYPLVAQDHLLGVLYLYSLRPHAFRDQLFILQVFANQAATAIVNARLFAETETAYEQLKRTSDQLVQSAKMAAIGELAAGVAHEINNPLTVVLGLSELLLQHSGPADPNREDLEEIASHARRARDIVRGLLSFARQTEFYRMPASINQVVQETLALSRQRLNHAQVIVEEHYDPDLPVLYLDVGRIKQVVLNLVTNTLYAMPQGGTMTLTTERVGDEVAIRVSDTGVGIPTDILSRIFEPFFSTRPVGQGTGLGLSISLGIVEQHEGRIEVQSQEGQGSTFTVWLPIANLTRL